MCVTDPFFRGLQRRGLNYPTSIQDVVARRYPPEQIVSPLKGPFCLASVHHVLSTAFHPQIYTVIGLYESSVATQLQSNVAPYSLLRTHI